MFFFSTKEGGRWRNFSLIFLESTKNLVIRINRSQLRAIRSTLQLSLSDQCTPTLFSRLCINIHNPTFSRPKSMKINANSERFCSFCEGHTTQVSRLLDEISAWFQKSSVVITGAPEQVSQASYRSYRNLTIK